MRIIEEGLTFGDFIEADCFHIEKTDIYKRLSGRGVKSVEFVLSKPDDNKLSLCGRRGHEPDRS